MAFRHTLRALAFRTLRLGFRLTPMPVATRDRLRQRFLSAHGNFVPEGPRGRAGMSIAHQAHDHAGHRMIDYRDASDASMPAELPATLVAFYLPQFHPFPENDAWWGKGFTEWRNVTRALPQFQGHLQPRLPGELGFYDLRLPDVMHAQAALARQYGIGAFCTYFYWFAGKVLMEDPFRQWLADPSLDMPICLCWANENWSRRWDGRAEDVLIAQKHEPADDLAFIAHIAPYLRDPRYLRVDGRPMLLVYRPGLLPAPSETAMRWRTWCRENGIGELHLAYVQSFDNVDPRRIGFDSAVTFPPNNALADNVTSRRTLVNPHYRGEILDWRSLTAPPREVDYPLHPAVNPGWDNEARRSGRGRTYVHASPAGYASWLRASIKTARQRHPRHPLVFINAWNEWAEGAVLEPDSARGHAWLEATRSALLPVPAAPPPVALVHVWHVELLDEIVQALKTSGITWRIIITTATDRFGSVKEACRRLGIEPEIVTCANRGRDVLPFLYAVAPLLLDGTRVLVKLHTKKTEHRADGDQWRRDLLQTLLSPARAERLHNAFDADASLGIVAPDHHVLRVTDYLGGNAVQLARLRERLDLADSSEDRFVAGSMFWARLDALRPLYEMDLGDWEFDPETGQVDGTLAHAVERFIALAAEHRGWRTREAHELLGEAALAHFTYAKRDTR